MRKKQSVNIINNELIFFWNEKCCFKYWNADENCKTSCFGWLNIRSDKKQFSGIEMRKNQIRPANFNNNTNMYLYKNYQGLKIFSAEKIFAELEIHATLDSIVTLKRSIIWYVVYNIIQKKLSNKCQLDFSMGQCSLIEVIFQAHLHSILLKLCM